MFCLETGSSLVPLPPSPEPEWAAARGDGAAKHLTPVSLRNKPTQIGNLCSSLVLSIELSITDTDELVI